MDLNHTSALIIPEELSEGENSSLKYQIGRLSLEAVRIHSDKLNLDFTAYVQDETTPSHQRCTIMTVHDLGCDHTSFQEFISCPEMRGLKDRIKWIHVDLPGQEPNASDLKISKYPSLPELAHELVNVLDHFKVGQVTLLGEGAGANICARFAMSHPTRCLGVALVHPSGTTATLKETFKDRFGSSEEAYLIWHRYGHSTGDLELVQANIKEFQTKLGETRNSKNLALFVEAYLNRTNIAEKMDELKVDVLIAVGKKASLSNGTKKFYKALYESRKSDRKTLANCALLEVEEVGDVMGETPDRLAISLQFFLQGIGLLPAMPMKKTLAGLGRLSRAFSMEDADKPRRISEGESSNSRFFSTALVK